MLKININIQDIKMENKEIKRLAEMEFEDYWNEYIEEIKKEWKKEKEESNWFQKLFHPSLNSYLEMMNYKKITAKNFFDNGVVKTNAEEIIKAREWREKIESIGK